MDIKRKKAQHSKPSFSTILSHISKDEKRTLLLLFPWWEGTQK